MKSVYIPFFVLIAHLWMAPFMQAQDVNEIIARHLKAHGDLDKWETIQSMKISGSLIAFSEEKDFFAIKTAAGAYYSELYLGQHPIVEAFNGKSGWTIDPWHDFLFPRYLNKNEVNVFHQKAEFFTPFYNYREHGSSVEYLGKEQVDGMDFFVLKLTRSNGRSETWYLDTTTYLEYKCESGWVDFAVGVPAESFFDDFRTLDGLVLPYLIERTFWQRDRIMQIEHIEWNPAVDSSLFIMPRSVEMEKLAFLEGDWDVKVAVPYRGGRWYTIDSTTSSIIFHETNMLQEQITYDNGYIQPKTINYSYSADAQKYRLGVYNGFGSELEIFEGGFADSSFTVNNASYVLAEAVPPPPITRMMIHQMTDDGFLLEISSSADGGASWNTSEKLTYKRRKK